MKIGEDWKESCCVVSEVCGYPKGKPRHSETWQWNKDVDVAAYRQRELFRI